LGKIMKPHQYADLFPMMGEAEYAALLDSMRSGYDETVPIVTYEGQILDGRNRYRAANELGITPPFVEYTGDDPLGFVIRHNLTRRHLNESQRAMIAGRLATMTQGNATGNNQWKSAHGRISTPEVSQPEAAAMLNVSERSIQRAKNIERDAPELVPLIDRGELSVRPAAQIAKMPEEQRARVMERIEAGERNASRAIREVMQAHPDAVAYDDEDEDEEELWQPKQRAQQAMGATVYSHKSLDYYTPEYVTNAAHDVMGGIDLDPASCAMAQEWINAKTYYTIDDDGLSKEWMGRVWLNPPYSYTDGRSNQDLWSSRLVTEYRSGNVTEGLLLVKAALGYKWFERLWDEWPVCFMGERLSFVMPDSSSTGQSKQATAIFYIGPNVSKFVEVFRTMGRVILLEDQKRG
jgi:ParB-like chromosome segregation protein Spo0J